MRTKQLKFFVLGSVMAAGGLFAVAVGDLLVFKAGDPIKSADVNTNFSTLRTAIQVLEAPVDAARLADKAVTAGKLGTSNAAVGGQILGFDGSGLVWQNNTTSSGGLNSVARNDTLQGDGTSANPLGVAFGLGLSGNALNGLYVGNTSNDPSSAGVKSYSDGAGVWGMSSGGYGLRGESNFVGVYGLSPSGNGVLGFSSSGNGVYGSNNNSDTSGHAGFFNGRVAITRSLNFGTTTRQMINLWGSVYGIGVQNNTQYFRSDGQFAWYQDGAHANNAFDAGGGTTLMQLQGNGDLEVKGTVKRSYSAGSYHSAAPVAYGHINASGTILSGTPNLSVSKIATGIYSITLAGETYDTKYITTVTAYAVPVPIIGSAYDSQGKLVVKMFDLQGNLADWQFQFVTYKP